MIPNFCSSIPGLTEASISFAEDKNVSLINRILSNISSANRYWYYIYISLFVPYAVIFGLGVKEDINYKNLQIYHYEDRSINNKL